MKIKQQADGSFYISMDDYINKTEPVQIAASRKAKPHAMVDDCETSEYRALAGNLLYLG